MFTTSKVHRIIIIAILVDFARGSTQRYENPKPSTRRFDPDDFLDTAQIIRRHGYPAETHIVATEDGYLIGLHRIPGSQDGKKGCQPVFLQHGLLGSSADWIMNGNNSLGFLLADQGYDVWLGNYRGNTYSRGHVTLPTWSAQYWNFSWHEMGIYDLPAALYYVSNTTGKYGEIIYIGHSMGGTGYLVMSSTKPEAAKNVKLMIGLAPASHMTNVTSPVRYLAPYANDIQWLSKYLGINELLPNDKLLKFLSYECDKTVKNDKICGNVLFIFLGFEKDEFNVDILPKVLSHDPAGTSSKTVLHYAQEIRDHGRFQQYDYGLEGNLIKYGTPSPPLYKMEKVKSKVYLMYAEMDNLASATDVRILSRELKNLVGLYKVPLRVFNHVDFIFGKDAYSLVYKKVLEVMKNFTIN
ncbi:unnamed protein product [Phaedon cochleariae]|uniref:Lipase n=1 Tax=Phaedon cochleariae TaxID=80249 RepID=A0A9P0DI38_PHACE|nr:unnamed protein product [Phaedon cochleariae]